MRRTNNFRFHWWFCQVFHLRFYYFISVDSGQQKNKPNYFLWLFSNWIFQLSCLNFLFFFFFKSKKMKSLILFWDAVWGKNDLLLKSSLKYALKFNSIFLLIWGWIFCNFLTCWWLIYSQQKHNILRRLKK